MNKKLDHSLRTAQIFTLVSMIEAADPNGLNKIFDNPETWEAFKDFVNKKVKK